MYQSYTCNGTFSVKLLIKKNIELINHTGGRLLVFELSWMTNEFHRTVQKNKGCCKNNAIVALLPSGGEVH